VRLRITSISTPGGRREDRRDLRECSRLPQDPAGAVADLVERVCQRRGGAKQLAGDAIPEGYSQIRRWAGDGDIPNLRQILRLIELAGQDDPFRAALVHHLEHLFDARPVDPQMVAAEVELRLAETVDQATAEQCAGIVRDVLGEPPSEQRFMRRGRR